jgi:hypothetical protein
MNTAHTRYCNGVKYEVLDKDDVRRFVLSVARAEWESHDFDKYGRDLNESTWDVQEVDVQRIKPNEQLLSSPEFKEDLKHRIDEVMKLMRTDQAIPPLILRGSDLLIFDGYARYKAFLTLRIGKCLAYVGH